MAKDNFKECLKIILHHEGGYVDHPKDPGGATNMGVTKQTYEDWVGKVVTKDCLLYTSPSPRDLSTYRMPSSA